MTRHDPVVIVGAARTPIGGFLGDLKDAQAPELGAKAIEAAVSRAGAPVGQIDEVAMGCVLSAGLGQAPARQASRRAGLRDETGCVTVNKMCGSGMKAIMLAHDQLVAGSSRLAVAGGMESMSNAPFLLERVRSGYRLGHRQIFDHMMLDGLEDAYEKGRSMGSFAEDCATYYQFTRQMQDDYAVASLTRAKEAIETGAFETEVVPVNVEDGRSAKIVVHDELPMKARVESITKMKPAFREGGTITAANASSISDGAAAVVLMRLEQAERLGLTPLASIRGHATHAGPPPRFPTAPIGAIRKLMDRVEWRLDEVDLFEINEAFAAVVLAAMRELGLPHEKVNVNGGACALGHPIGASGARIVVTVLEALRRRKLRRGVAALCIGGGEATALAIEVMN